VYVPFVQEDVGLQKIYQYFGMLSKEVMNAIKMDFADETFNDIGIHMDQICTIRDVPLRTVGLIYNLFQSALRIEGVLSCDGKLNHYSKKSIAKAQEEIYQIVAACKKKEMLSFFFLDEVPPSIPGVNDLRKSSLFCRCIFLRNIIRSIRLVVIMAGTDSSAINMIGFNTNLQSRCEPQSFVRLIVQLPPLMPNLLSDELVPTISSICHRPLFCKWILEEMSRNKKISWRVFQNVGLRVRTLKRTMSSCFEGVFSQVALRKLKCILQFLRENDTVTPSLC
jgi:hypothetical protein